MNSHFLRLVVNSSSISSSSSRNDDDDDVNNNSGQNNLTKGHIAAAHGRFNRIRQVAPICTPIGIHLHRFCMLLSRFKCIDRGHVRALAVCHLQFLFFKIKFSVLCSVPILYNGTPFSPQNYPFPWGIWTRSNTWFLGPTQVLNPNGISIDSSGFAGFTSVTDRQTRYSVGNNRPHLRT